MRRIAFAAASILVLASVAEAQSCRNDLQGARLTIGGYVEALRGIEADVLSRLMGGGQPQFEDLARDAKAVAAMIYSPESAQAEERLRRCRNWVPPVRRTCRDAAVRLGDVIAESAQRRLSDDSRLDYARLISRCETWLGMPHRASFLRMP